MAKHCTYWVIKYSESNSCLSHAQQCGEMEGNCNYFCNNDARILEVFCAHSDADDRAQV